MLLHREKHGEEKTWNSDEAWAGVREVFGEERFAVMQEVYFELAEKYEIYYYDFTQRNMNFGD